MLTKDTATQNEHPLGISTRLLYILLGIIVVLSLIAVFPSIKKLLKLSDQKSIGQEIKVNDINFNKVTEVAIKKGEDQKRITLKDNKWTLNDKEVKKEKIDELFKDLKDLKLIEVASINKDNHAALGLTETDAYSLVLISNGKVNEYWIGNAATGTNTYYFKERDGDKAYVAQSSLRSILAQDEATWTGTAADSSTPTSTN